jgi:hypothetical protein
MSKTKMDRVAMLRKFLTLKYSLLATITIDPHQVLTTKATFTEEKKEHYRRMARCKVSGDRQELIALFLAELKPPLDLMFIKDEYCVQWEKYCLYWVTFTGSIPITIKVTGIVPNDLFELMNGLEIGLQMSQFPSIVLDEPNPMVKHYVNLSCEAAVNQQDATRLYLAELKAAKTADNDRFIEDLLKEGAS